MSASLSTFTFNSNNTNNIAKLSSASGKPKLFLLSLAALTLFSFFLTSCGGGEGKKDGGKHAARCHGKRPHPGDPEGNYEFITTDSANKMLSSYLASINAPVNDSDIHSIIINADTLRAYLADTTIHDIKIMMAHTLSYINAGGRGQPCGYDSRDLTFIIAGYNDMGNYVYYHCGVPIASDVIDHGMPCPTVCPPGNASNDILTR